MMERMKSSGLHCFTVDSTARKPTGTGLLDGLTFAAKDLIAIAGHVSSFGSARWRETHTASVKDSSVLTRLLGEGAELIGTAKMDQLAYSIVGDVAEGTAPVNTKYPEQFCGGSSSGSASAVAGSIVDFAIGSDTGGSVRIPAAACGIYGIRTTYGLVPKDGVIPLAASSDVLGFFARTPEVLKKVMAVFALSAAKPITFRRLLLPTNLEDYAAVGVRQLRQMAQKIAQSNGLVVEEVDIARFVSPEATGVMGRNHSREIWATHGLWVEQNKAFLAADVLAGMETCKDLSKDAASIIQKDTQAYTFYGKELRQLIGEDAVLCLPVLPVGGPNLGWSGEALRDYRKRTFRLVLPSSVSGLPEVSAPIGETTVSIGLIGPQYSDEQLIGLLYQMEIV